MITQADVDKAKSAVDAALALREAYWNGNPDGNYSVVGWMQELQKCDSSNAVSRDANLNLKISFPINQGGCSHSNFTNVRLPNFIDRTNKYKNALSDWRAKDTAYQKLLADFATQSAANATQATANQTQASANATSLKPKLYFAAIVIIVIVVSAINVPL